MKPALLVIDLQKAFVKHSPQTAQSFKDAIECINATIALFREKNLPIVCIQNVNEEENLMPGEADYDVLDELKVLSSDLHIHKHYDNAFNKTPLADRLRESGIDTVVVTGYCAEYCVLSTYRGSEDNDLAPIILRGSLASDTPENIKFVESISDTISYGALRSVLR